MGFLSKIQKYIQGNKNREFREQVREEKRQKYLFSDAGEKGGFQSSRNTDGWLKKKKKHRPSSFSSTFTNNYSSVKKFFQDSTILFALGVLLLGLSSYIIFFSPYFRVSPSHVLMESENEGIDMSLAYRSIEDIYGKSLFVLNEEDVAITLKKSLRNLSHISINKLYPNGVKILMRSSPVKYSAQIHGIDKAWSMTENGVLIPNVHKSPPTVSGEATGSVVDPSFPELQIVSEDLRGEVFFDYKQVIDESRMLLIAKVLDIFASEWKDIPLAKIRYFADEDELHIGLKGGTTILLTLQNINGETGEQTRINTLKNELIGLKTYIDKYKNALSDTTVTYIDARVIRKIFVCKPKDACLNNLIRIYGDSYKE